MAEEAEAEYYSKDFEWEDLRREVENDPSLRYHLASFVPSSSCAATAVEADAWRSFHRRHSAGKFFKERRYLLKEFPELIRTSDSIKVLEKNSNKSKMRKRIEMFDSWTQIPENHMLNYIAQVLGVIVALLEDPDESVQITAVQCLLSVLSTAREDAVDPILINLSVRLRNLQICMNEKMRSKAFATYGALSKYAKGSQHQTFLEQVHATIPRLILHLHDDDLNVRQACRITLRQLAPLIEVEGFSNLFHKQVFSSDRRSDYEDFIRDLSRLVHQFLSPRVDSYLASLIQAFDSPWPVIQANAVYFSSCLLSLAEDQRLLAPYCSQVFGALVNKMSKSRDAVVRAACSFALGILIKAFNPLASATPPRWIKLTLAEVIFLNKLLDFKPHRIDKAKKIQNSWFLDSAVCK
ncbi:protein SHOOT GRAVITROPISM 6-like [Curcuma longa]|uniref:protein SHOOT GRAVITROPISM 6-like n=1 Tax=Curcuma longa TaxID=136217 RepID=UPI003D9F6C87